MKRLLSICALCLPLLEGGGFPPSLHAQTFDNLWKQVEQAQRKNLPQTVIELTGQIADKAERERNPPQLMKATLCRDSYQERLTPDSFYTNLAHLEQWAETETDALNRAILHSILAERYAYYARSNGYALRQRTLLDTDEAPADIREWTANLFFRQVDAHVKAALDNPDLLMDASTRTYKPFVKQQSGSRHYAHDFLHLLLGRAVESYAAMAGLIDDDLCNERIDGLYRQAIAAYETREGREDAVVLCTTDLVSHQQENEEARLEMLNRLIARYGDRDVCAEAYILKAECLSETDNPRIAQALETCREGIARYPKNKRTNRLKEIRDNLLRPELSVQTPQYFYPGDTLTLNVGYEQLKGFTLNLYASAYTGNDWTNRDINNQANRKGSRRVSSTHFDLTPLPGDNKPAEDVPYLPSDTTFRLPTPSEPGLYWIEIVPDEGKYRRSDQYVAATRLHVSYINIDKRQTEFVVRDAQSGQPVEGATVRFYSSHPSDSKRKTLLTLTTDAQGKALLNRQEHKDIRSFAVSTADDRCLPAKSYYVGGVPDMVDESAPSKRLTLLTDRSLYRPGQTVYVKGIAYQQGKDKAEVLRNAKYELSLLDANQQEIATREVRTNDFGSFTAEFALPTACLNGQFSVRAKNQSRTTFRVEEYKRPTFELSFLPIETAYRLGDVLTLRGEVKAYNGRSADGVPVAYTVHRRNPFRSYWNPDEKPLLSDTVRTDAEGRFSVDLLLETPADEKQFKHLLYYYNIEASATDEAGETQTANQTVMAGNKAYDFALNLSPEICKEDSLCFTLGVTNRSHIPQQPASATYRLYAQDSDMPAQQGEFTPNRPHDFSAWRQLPSGRYRLVLTVSDSLQREESTETNVLLFSREDKRPAPGTDLFCYVENNKFDSTHPAAFLFGTSHSDAYVLMDVFCQRRRIESRVINLTDSIVRFDFPYQDSYGEGISINLNFVKNGTNHERTVTLEKRQPDRRLQMRWQTFRDRLRPGQAEEWRLVIQTPQGLPAAAELLALMYDASLDQIYKRDQLLQVSFPRNVFPVGRTNIYPRTTYLLPHFLIPDYERTVLRFDYFDGGWGSAYDLILDSHAELAVGNAKLTSRSMVFESSAGYDLAQTEVVEAMPLAQMEEAVAETEDADGNEAGGSLSASEAVRTNFAETAFFYPQLRTNEQGEVVISFTVPQSLTRWNVCGYAHTQDMLTGQMGASVVTAKEFMLTPNLPRFVRTGDETEVTATVANLTQEELKGTVRFVLFDPDTEKVISTRKQKFTAEAGRNAVVHFRFEADERYSLLGVRLVADAGDFSDGEQHLLPVLSDKTYLTETLPMPIRGEETRTFDLTKLFNNDSRTATHRRLTVEFTGNPAWYAVQALPALSEPTADNAIAWATTFYANTLAGHIANSQPRIKAVFDQWLAQGQGKETLLSRLEQNQDLKSTLLEESPWVMEAQDETDRMRRIATLFDLNRQSNLTHSALTKLQALQGGDGSWSWFKGMAGSRMMTDYIATLLVRLPLLTGDALPAPAKEMQQKAFAYLHEQALEEYKDLRRAEKRGTQITHLSSTALNYLYLIALSGESVPQANKTAYDYFLSRAKNELPGTDMARKSQAAVVLVKAGRKAEAADLLASIREHLIQEDELGAHFAFADTPYDWGMMPIPVHVSAMEALQLAGGNEALIEEMKLWLLKQKQTNSWDNAVATADATYALLCTGTDLLANRGDVRITLGKTVIETQNLKTQELKNSIAQMGYVKQTFADGTPELKAQTISVEKRDEGIAWGAVYAQYLSPTADVQAHGNALNVSKQLYVERIAPDGQKSLKSLEEAGQLRVGDKVVARLTLRIDRAMDFLHLKDQRAACLEPTGMLSGYRWQNGFGYYVEVEDAATHFFFDHLGKGVYVLEYSYRLDRTGRYQTGLATLQCAYAPEFSAHSTGGRIAVE